MGMQITGGHKYLPPRQDVNAPDLYIPFMAVCTFCLLACVSKLVHGSFTPESMYAVVCLLSPSLASLPASLLSFTRIGNLWQHLVLQNTLQEMSWRGGAMSCAKGACLPCTGKQRLVQCR